MEMTQYKPENIGKIPAVSGLYFFYDRSELLYIGKAKFLKYRIKEHYKENKINLKYIKELIEILGKEVKNIDWILFITSRIQSSQIIDLQYHKIKEIKINYMS